MTRHPDRTAFVLASPFGPAFDGAFNAYLAGAAFLCTPTLDISGVEATATLNRYFQDALGLNRNENPHLFNGLLGSVLSEPSGRNAIFRPTMIMKRLAMRSRRIEQALHLDRERLSAARVKRSVENDPIEILFSPFYFLRQYLTDPDYPGTDAYAHSLIRAQIFADALRYTIFHPERSADQTDAEHPFIHVRKLIKFERVVASLQKIERHWRNRDNIAPANGTDFIVMHLLASRGYLVLRLGRKFLRDRKEWRVSRAEFLESKGALQENETYEFRVLPEVARLPIASELINEIDGLPLPIPGSDVVLHRGLRFAEDSGVVLRVSGRTGTGKTSVALGIAVALAPLGTRTVYLSCEEKQIDLEHRIQTLVPQNLRRLDVFHRIEPDWFSAEYVSGNHQQKLERVERFLNEINATFVDHIESRWETPPGTMPLLIVIDGIHEIFAPSDKDEFQEQARGLIEKCRDTGAIVIVLSAKNEQAIPDELDYLVDFVAGVDFGPVKDSWERPVRTITIQKTRRQSSRVGTHILHISGRQGLRIAPQVAAQLDQRRNFKWVQPRPDLVYDFLLRPQIVGGGNPRNVNRLVEIYDRSQVLVTGLGSGGKSVFGFKLLTTSLLKRSDLQDRLPTASEGHQPLTKPQGSLFEDATISRFKADDESELDLDMDLKSTWFEPTLVNRRKFLVLSFLYEADYYRELWARISPYRRTDALFRENSPRVSFDVHSFSPGYLRPEDFLTIVSQMLDKHELEGWPYDGVLIDGLHNVYLQFPLLEQSEMVWPMLFQLLRTRGLTVVTTHTYFSIDPGLNAVRLDVDDVDSARRRAGPLLHALVQATDFRVRIAPENARDADRLHATYPSYDFGTRIDVLGAIGQPVSSDPLYWDRDRGVVFGLSRSDRGRAISTKRAP
jgi:KaiC/GvpD/RAD55 family RecA-like ATPase